MNGAACLGQLILATRGKNQAWVKLDHDENQKPSPQNQTQVNENPKPGMQNLTILGPKN